MQNASKSTRAECAEAFVLCESITRKQLQSLPSFTMGVAIFALESRIIVTNT